VYNNVGKFCARMDFAAGWANPKQFYRFI